MALGEAVLKITANVQGLIGGLNKGAAKMKAFGKKVGDIGKAIAGAGLKIAAFGAAILAAFLPAIVQGAKFEQSMADASAVIGDVFEQNVEGGKTVQNFELLNQKAMELGETTEFSASQVAEAMKYMGMAGMTTAQITAGVGGVLELASAGSLDLARAADIATDSMSAFNLVAADLGRINDVMAATAAGANTSIEMMGESFKYVAPLASGLGQSVEDVSLMLGLLANKGIKASSAGTSLNQAMATLAVPTEKLTEVLQRNGLTFDQVNSSQNNMIDVIGRLRAAGVTAGDMLEAFGKRGGRAILSLVQTSQEAFDELADQINNSFGEAAKQSLIKLDTMKGDWKKFWSAVEGVNIRVFDQLNVALRPITQHITSIVQAVGIWIDQNEHLAGTLLRIIAGIGVAAVAIGSALMAIGGLVGAIGLLITFKAAILGAFAAGLAAIFSFKAAIIAAITVVVIPIILALMATWDQLKTTMLAFYTNVVQPVFQGWMAAVQALFAVVKPIWDYLVTSLNELWRTLEDLYNSLAPFHDAIKKIAMAFAMWTLAPLALAIGVVMGAVIAFIKVLQQLYDIARRVADIFSLNWSRAFESSEARTKRLAAETESLARLQETLGESVQSTITEFDKVADAISRYTGAMRELSGGLERFNDLTPLEIENLKKLHGQLGEVTDRYENNLEAIREHIEQQKRILYHVTEGTKAYQTLTIRIALLEAAEKSLIENHARQAEATAKLIEKYGSLEEAYRKAEEAAAANKIKQDALTESNKTQGENVSKLLKLKEELAAAEQPLLDGYAKEVFALHELASAQKELVASEIMALELARMHGPQDEEIIAGIDRKIESLYRLVGAIARVRNAQIARIQAEQDEDLAAYEQTQDFKLQKQEITLAKQQKKFQHAINLERDLRMQQIEAERQAELQKIEELFSGRIESAREEYAQLREMKLAEISANKLLSDEERQLRIENINSIHNARMKVLDEWEARNEEKKDKAITNANKVAENDEQIANNQHAIDTENLEKKEKAEKDAAKDKIKREQEIQNQKNKGLQQGAQEVQIEQTILGEMVKRAKTVQQLAAVHRFAAQERLKLQQQLKDQVTEVSQAEKRVLQLKEKMAKAGSDAERKRLQSLLDNAEDKLAFEQARQDKLEGDSGIDIEDNLGEKLARLQELQAQITALTGGIKESLTSVGTMFSEAGGSWIDSLMTAWTEKFPGLIERITADLAALTASFQNGFQGVQASFQQFLQALSATVEQMEVKAQRATAAARQFQQAQNVFNNQQTTNNSYGAGGQQGSPGDYGGA